MNDILRLAWDRWQIIGRINGDYVARFITITFYFTILVPFALGLQLLSDPLALRKQVVAHWIARKPVGSGIEDARGQF